MQYGELPRNLGHVDVDCPEMLFYQYLPIKLANDVAIPGDNIESRLKFLIPFLGKVMCDYIGEYGISKFCESYVYVTIKKMYQMPGCSFNREGWHSDGFGTDDINYIWSDKFPTVFNSGNFDLPQDDKLSLAAMENQANPANDVVFPESNLLRLNQYNIHKVAEISHPAMRTFIKVSFSRDKYDLEGNSHNYQLDYNWPMKKRGEARNIPQSVLTK